MTFSPNKIIRLYFLATSNFISLSLEDSLDLFSKIKIEGKIKVTVDPQTTHQDIERFIIDVNEARGEIGAVLCAYEGENTIVFSPM